MEEAELRIGEVASRTGVSIDTLRYYEKRRLLGRARRSSGGFRLFAHEAVERVPELEHSTSLRSSRRKHKAQGGAKRNPGINIQIINQPA